MATVTNGGISSLTITDARAPPAAPATSSRPNLVHRGGGTGAGRPPSIVERPGHRATSLTQPGVGYTSAPTVMIDPSLGQATASATAAISNSQVAIGLDRQRRLGLHASEPAHGHVRRRQPDHGGDGHGHRDQRDGHGGHHLAHHARGGLPVAPDRRDRPVADARSTGLTITGGGTVSLPSANTTLTGTSNIDGGTLILGSGVVFGSGDDQHQRRDDLGHRRR